jgi:hypothetical protein
VLATAIAFLAACSGGLPPASLPAAGDTGSACDASSSASALLLSLPASQRNAIATALHQGPIAAVSYDCKGLRLLPGCQIKGRYTWIGLPPQRSVLSLATADEVRWNAPATPGGAPVRAPVTVALLVAGHLTATKSEAKRADLAGACAEATHFIYTADVGASGPPSAPSPDCEGVSKLETTAPRPECAEPVRLHLMPIDTAASFDVARAMPRMTCPPDAVLSEGKCVSAPAATHYQCRLGEVEQCRAQCGKGHQGSCTTLGWMLLRGARGLELDLEAGLKLSLGACEAGEPVACGNAAIALTALSESSGAKIAELYSASCGRGDAESCLDLGLMFRRSGGDDPERLALQRFALARACQAGSAAACGHLGELAASTVEEGALAAARALFERACDGGEPTFCQPFALMMWRGEGGSTDPRRAYHLLHDTCGKGVLSACANEGIFHQNGEVIEQDYAAAAKLFDKSCLGGAPDGCRMLAFLFENALGRSRDFERAAGLYAKGCAMADAGSCSELGRLHLEGQGILKNEARAAQLFEQSCEGGAMIGCHNLALLLDRGQGIAKDPARATALHRRACDGGFPRSCRQLAAAKP